MKNIGSLNFIKLLCVLNKVENVGFVINFFFF